MPGTARAGGNFVRRLKTRLRAGERIQNFQNNTKRTGAMLNGKYETPQHYCIGTKDIVKGRRNKLNEQTRD